MVLNDNGEISMNMACGLTSGRFVSVLLALLLTSGCATLASLGMTNADPHRVRGTIEDWSGSSLRVNTREGDLVEVQFGFGWQVVGVETASLQDVEPGDFVGIASVPMTDGRDGALELVIFPADMAGYGEGTYPWDLEPNSTMTNGTVANAVEMIEGNALTLNYEGGARTIMVPEDVPIVTLVEATTDQLVPDAAVFVPGNIDKHGNIYALAVIVGSDGVVPPM